MQSKLCLRWFSLTETVELKPNQTNLFKHPKPNQTNNHSNQTERNSSSLDQARREAAYAKPKTPLKPRLDQFGSAQTKAGPMLKRP
jgi:hypothetical protein